MEKFDIILWVSGGGFALMLMMWHSMNQRMDKLDIKVESVNTSLNAKIESVNTSLHAKIESVNTSLSAKIESVNTSLSAKTETVSSTLSAKIDKLDEKVTDIDRRLCRLEGAFASKDCCMIKDERPMKKAE